MGAEEGGEISKKRKKSPEEKKSKSGKRKSTKDVKNKSTEESSSVKKEERNGGDLKIAPKRSTDDRRGSDLSVSRRSPHRVGGRSPDRNGKDSHRGGRSPQRDGRSPYRGGGFSHRGGRSSHRGGRSPPRKMARHSPPRFRGSGRGRGRGRFSPPGRRRSPGRGHPTDRYRGSPPRFRGHSPPRRGGYRGRGDGFSRRSPPVRRPSPGKYFGHPADRRGSPPRHPKYSSGRGGYSPPRSRYSPDRLLPSSGRYPAARGSREDLGSRGHPDLLHKSDRPDLRRESRYPDQYRKELVADRPSSYDRSRRHSVSPLRKPESLPRRGVNSPCIQTGSPPRRADSPLRRLDSPLRRPDSPPIRSDSLSRRVESPPQRLLSPPRDPVSPLPPPKFIDSFGPVPRSVRMDVEARNSRAKEERLKDLSSRTSSADSRRELGSLKPKKVKAMKKEPKEPKERTKKKIKSETLELPPLSFQQTVTSSLGTLEPSNTRFYENSKRELSPSPVRKLSPRLQAHIEGSYRAPVTHVNSVFRSGSLGPIEEKELRKIQIDIRRNIPEHKVDKVGVIQRGLGNGKLYIPRRKQEGLEPIFLNLKMNELEPEKPREQKVNFIPAPLDKYEQKLKELEARQNNGSSWEESSTWEKDQRPDRSRELDRDRSREQERDRNRDQEHGRIREQEPIRDQRRDWEHSSQVIDTGEEERGRRIENEDDWRRREEGRGGRRDDDHKRMETERGRREGVKERKAEERGRRDEDRGRSDEDRGRRDEERVRRESERGRRENGQVHEDVRGRRDDKRYGVDKREVDRHRRSSGDKRMDERRPRSNVDERMDNRRPRMNEDEGMGDWNENDKIRRSEEPRSRRSPAVFLSQEFPQEVLFKTEKEVLYREEGGRSIKERLGGKVSPSVYDETSRQAPEVTRLPVDLNRLPALERLGDKRGGVKERLGLHLKESKEGFSTKKTFFGDHDDRGLERVGRGGGRGGARGGRGGAGGRFKSGSPGGTWEHDLYSDELNEEPTSTTA